ncbi:MAG: hypothetical protein AAFN93_21100 [Bacteroidota bacterium]
MYDPTVGRWNGVDALAEKRSWLSPFQYAQNNSILRIDPDGNLDSPIYDVNGEFLGTDDQGLQGEAIVMSSAYFEQGMTHNEALEMGHTISEVRKQEGLGPLSNEAIEKIDNHVEGLSRRPDWDGVVTIDEGVEWAKLHPNMTRENVTPDDALYLNVAAMDFGSLRIEEFNTIGIEQPVNLLNSVNMLSDRSRFTTYALGRTRMTLLDEDGTVSVSNGEFKVPGRDFNDYDWNSGGGAARTILIGGERIIKGLGDSHGFPLKVYGVGTLNQ